MESSAAKKAHHTNAPSKAGSRADNKRSVSLVPKARGNYMRIFNAMLKEIESYRPGSDLGLLRKAYTFSYQAHKNQLRKSGAPYFEHCLETAAILVELRMDPITIAAALLHDVVEDTGVTIEEVEEIFGSEIAQLVDGVTKISELKFASHAQKQAENFRKMVFSMARDLRVIIIKLADRLHNMRTLEYLPNKKTERIALETMEVYAPLAHRFGIARIKWELEDLSFHYLKPAEYIKLMKALNENRSQQETYINNIVDPLKKEMEKYNIYAEIDGRAKTLYSIYNKMQHRNKPLDEIYDILAIRIIVDKIDACYFALGIVHTLFTPVHDRFKDYIATPKLNLYQSLHTTVIGPEGKMVEIQVRTHEMHRVAEMGIAAHWKFKEGRQEDTELDRYSSWLREMIDWHKDSLSPEEYLELFKTDLFVNEVFVFTPKGDLLSLPNGATPVDFAFTVHTDIGLHCIGAKVNGKIVSLNTPLNNGDSVEIITSVNQKPNRDWLQFVKTSKAKSCIKRWIKEKQFGESVRLGEEILNKGLKRFKLKPDREITEKLSQFFDMQSKENLFAALGRGEISINRIIDVLMPDKSGSQESEKDKSAFVKFVDRARGHVRGISVQGIDNLLIRFAKCCHPVPGDSIEGFISKGRGIVIHRSDCKNAVYLLQVPNKHIAVSWDVGENETFLVRLKVVASEKKEFLQNIADTFAKMKTRIIKIEMNTEQSLITTYIILEVKDVAHLSRINRNLMILDSVISVERSD
jgi:GTP diphosphokinase / guanosine-3',5'-bis(diphosphate) 3'-diphosphatase